MTKTGLDKVDGWLFSVSSSDSITVSINQMEYTTFADPFAQVNVSDSYILGEKFVYTLIENGVEISRLTEDANAIKYLSEGMIIEEINILIQ